MAAVFAVCATVLLIVAAVLTSHGAGAGAVLPLLVVSVLFVLGAFGESSRGHGPR